jgi:hypothetical protein
MLYWLAAHAAQLESLVAEQAMVLEPGAHAGDSEQGMHKVGKDALVKVEPAMHGAQTGLAVAEPGVTCLKPPAVLQGVQAAHVGAAKPEADQVPAAQEAAAMHPMTVAGLYVKPVEHVQ